MGGETLDDHQVYDRDQGLSPRGRGNPVTDQCRAPAGGSIPAWAGKPRPPRGSRCTAGVYPRVGGETHQSSKLLSFISGLSPRGRGNQRAAMGPPDGKWSIPAWAGKPIRRYGRRATPEVYPRVGGETGCCCAGSQSVGGLSPRGRGNRGSAFFDSRTSGSIPAWAGKPLRHSDSFVCICQRSLVLLGRYGGSPAMCRIRFHTSLASGRAR